MITEEKLKEHIEKLRQQLSQLQANANAVAGALQFAEAILAEPQEAVSDKRE